MFTFSLLLKTQPTGRLRGGIDSRASYPSGSVVAVADDRDRHAVPTNSNAYMTILRKLVELWRGASDAPQAGKVMNETHVKERGEEGASRSSRRDQAHRDTTED